MLNRKHAQLMIDNSRFADKPTFCDNEHFPGSILALHNCLHEIIPVDFTYVNWKRAGQNKKTPFTFYNLYENAQLEEIFRAIKEGLLFARKFDEKCDLTLLDVIFALKILL